MENKIANIIETSWNSVMPHSLLSMSESLFGEDYIISKAYIAIDRTEATNNIIENDPLSLMFTVTPIGEGYVIEYSSSSLAVKPDNIYYAFGRKKIPLRKTKAKNDVELEKKLKVAFNKVKDSIKEALNDGDFEVYNDEIVKIISSKV